MKKYIVLFGLFILFGLVVGNKAVADCPPEYIERVVEFTTDLPFDPTEHCGHSYFGLCRYRAYFCVKCDVTAPIFDIYLKKVELISLNGNFSKGYRCHCGRGLYSLQRPNFIYDFIESEAYSTMLQLLLEENFCGLRICDGEPPSTAIYASIKTFDCYKLKYVPICTGEPPVQVFVSAYCAIEYCNNYGYCEKIYRACVEIDPLTGRASLRKELISTSHYGTSDCISVDLVFPPGTEFPRYGDCIPDETECMYVPNCN